MPLRRPLASLLLFLGLVLPLFPAAGQTLDAGERERLTTALRALGARDFDAATAAARGLPEPLPTAIEWWRLLEEESPAPSFAELARFREARAEWPRRNAMAIRVEHAAVTAPAADVARHLQRFPPQTAYGRWAAARALAALGDDDTAALFARAAWRDSAVFTDGDEALFLGQFAAVLSNEDHRARLDDLAWRGLEREIERTLPLVDPDYRKLIEARIAVRLRRPGVDAKVAAVPPALARDPGLLYERARFRRRAGNATGAAEILLQSPTAVAEPQQWWTERRIAYRDAIEQEDFRLAYRLAANHGGGEGRGFSDSEWHAGWLALRFLDRPADALAHFERVWADGDTPITRARAAYWAGRAAAALGREREAQAWFEVAAEHGIAFYGQEAALELGRSRFELGPELPVGGRASLRASELGRLAALLAQVDDTYMLPVVTNALASEAPTAEATAAGVALAQELGRYDSAIRGYIPLYRQGVISAAASHPVPARFTGLLRPGDGEVSPALALSIARQESRFVPTAVSSAGARGLMQLMPATAKGVARDLGVPADLVRLTRDPDYNAALGTRYVGDLMRRFGDPALAAAGYNAGPSRSVQWMGTLGDPRRLDRHAYLDWLERIPFAETRNYVQRIIEGERVYASLLAGG